jgi:Fe-S-cluster containining protein
MNEFDKFKEEILKKYPRLQPNSPFRFECHHGVSCFNDCCGDVNIFLTPYDLIRLKNRLGITSGQFLDRHTISPFTPDAKYPVVLLRMGDDEKKKCVFNKPDGCQVYGDRPWACRMYPLGVASPGEDSDELDDEFYFLLKESHCRGFEETTEQTVQGYKENQGVTEYEEMGEGFKTLTTHRFFREGNQLDPAKMDMFYMVCYDIDNFRKFIFGSTFFDKFIVDEKTKEEIKTDDVALLRFGYKWLRFALFAEPTMTIRTEIREAKEQELAAEEKTQPGQQVS